MRTWMFAVVASFTLSFTTVFAYAGALHEPKKLCTGFLPPNSLRIPVGAKLVGGITKTNFNQVLDRIARLYEPEFRRRGGQLTIIRDWAAPEVNAYADRNGNAWSIRMFGGLARHRAITPDGFAMVACHEIGHHLGGAPKYGGASDPDSIEWASNEGQSDYYATLKCMRRFFDGDDNEKILAGMKLDPIAVKACEREHRNRADQRLCIRGSMAGLSLGTLFQDLGNAPQIRFDKPDKRKVAQTEDAHPAAQCRLDTYFHGALCTVPVSQALSETDYRPGSCVDKSQTPGLRPRCWFKP